MPGGPSGHGPVAPDGPDIALPFRTRSLDPKEAVPVEPEAARRIRAAYPVVPFPVPELLDATVGPYGLNVEVKHDDRVVGSWHVECSPGDPTGLLVSHVRAELHVCGSPAGNPRETGAFLAVSDWWVSGDDEQQVLQLYEQLSTSTVLRLASLLGDAALNRIRNPHPLALYLLDVRRRNRRPLSLAALESSLLDVLADGPAIPGVDLRVAHGRGTGSSPLRDTAPGPMAATGPMPLFAAATEPAPLAGAPAPAPSPAPARVGEVFIREQVSGVNAKWNRRATDRR